MFSEHSVDWWVVTDLTLPEHFVDVEGCLGVAPDSGGVAAREIGNDVNKRRLSAYSAVAPLLRCLAPARRTSVALSYVVVAAYCLSVFKRICGMLCVAGGCSTPGLAAYGVALIWQTQAW